MEEPQQERLPMIIHPEVARDSRSGAVMNHIRTESRTDHEAIRDAGSENHYNITLASSHDTGNHYVTLARDSGNETVGLLQSVSPFYFKKSDKYRCGGCSKEFTTVGNLHHHLVQHTSDGSYYFDGLLRIAFPKYGTSCKATQTVSHQPNCSEEMEALDLHSQLENTDTVSAVDSVYIKQENVEIQETDDGNNVIACEAETLEHKIIIDETKDNANKEIKQLVQIAVAEVLCETGNSNEQQTDDEENIDTMSDGPNDVCIVKGRHKRRSCNDKYLRKSEDKNTTNTDIERVSEDSTVSGLNEQLIMETKAVRQSRKLQQKKCNNKRIKGAKCYFCGSIFADPNALRKHQNACHKDELIIPCNICGKLLSNKHTLRTHMHLHNQTFSCQICEKVCKSQSRLTEHQLVHSGTKNFICQHCGEAFYTSHALDNHINKCLGIQPFSCPHDGCNKRFYYKHSVAPHVRQHTGERPFVCECCGKAYARANKLHEHLKTHTGDKPWQCPSCPKAFTRSDLLQRHERTHTKVTPFKCRFCARSFSHAWNLKSHERQHTGETPYKCDVCGRGFTHNVSRKTHMASHHKVSNCLM